MSDAPMAVVAGHGALAAGLVSAVEQITGQGERFVTLSNASLSGEQVEQALRAAIAGSSASVVFTDLPAGSWTIAARRVQRDTPHIVVVTGVNLAMLLDFLFQAGDAASTADAVVEKGRAAIGAVSSPATQAPSSRPPTIQSVPPAAPQAPQSAVSSSPTVQSPPPAAPAAPQSVASSSARSAESANND